MRTVGSLLVPLTLVLASVGAPLLTACGATDDATNPAGETPAPAPTPPVEPATVRIDSISLNQSVSVPLLKKGELVEAATRVAPVIANRPGLLRVSYASTAPKSAQRPRLRGELHMLNAKGEEVFVRNAEAVATTSSEAVLLSTLNFDLAAADIQVGHRYWVKVTSTAGAEARFPEEDALALDAKLGPKVVMRLVPVRFQYEGRDLLPETTEVDLEAYTQVLRDMYPAAEVKVDVREPIAWTRPIRANGAGWEELLDAVGELRQTDSVPANVFYMGLFRSERNLEDYCDRGCVLGLAPSIPGSANASAQFALSAGWGGETTSFTVAHELGHNLGRPHAPCGGAAGTDRRYPYEDGYIGSWGFDLTTKQLLDPTEYTDVMGYCQPQWISDYTYGALFQRLTQVNARVRSTPPASRDEASDPVAVRGSRLIRVTADGTLVPGPRVDVPVNLGGSVRNAVGPKSDLTDGTVAGLDYVDGAGRVLAHVPATFIPFDHLPGGYVAASAALSAELETRVVSVRVQGVPGLTQRALSLR